MRVIKIHNVMQFKQKQFLRPYTEFNSRQSSLTQQFNVRLLQTEEHFTIWKNRGRRQEANHVQPHYGP